MKKLIEYPKIFFTAVVALQTVFLINTRALWFSDEIRYANAYDSLTNGGHWLVLFLNGEPYPDKPPLYFWLVWIVQHITRLEIPSAMFLATAITGVMFILSHYWFAMTVTKDEKLGFYSTLVLLSNFFLIALFNYIRMDLLFAALIILSYTFIYKYLTTDSRGSVYIAFLLASAAVLTKGPIGIVMPLLFFLLGVVFFKKWRKLFSIHFLLGFLLTVLPILGWIFAIISIEGMDYLKYLIETQVVKRAVHTWHHAEPVYYYVYALFLAWLPWVFVLFTGGVRKLTADLWHRSDGGKFVLFSMISGFLFLSALSGKIAIYALPIFSPMAIYIAWLFMKGAHNKAFWRIVSLFFLILGVMLIFLNRFHFIPGEAHWNGFCGGVAIAVAVFVWFISSGSQYRAVLGFVLCAVVFFNAAGLTMIPSMDDLLSPKKQGTLMKNYIAEGYEPVAYKVYSALYTFYAGQTVYETKELDEVSKLMDSDKKIVLGIAEKYWTKWDTKPEHYKIVDRQWISGREYFLILNR